MTILIIEDEPRTAGLLREFIQSAQPSAVLLPAIDSIDSAVNYLTNHLQQPDLVFMDIQLADGCSFEIFDRIKLQSPVVFCTAYEEFTLRAFKANGVDYILKPFTEQDISNALEKFSALKKVFATSVVSQLAEPSFSPKKYNSHFLVSYRDKMFPINASTIAIIYIEAELVYLVTLKNEKFPFNRKMEDAEALLDPTLFFRISRQVIINREAIENIEVYFNRKLFVRLKINSPVQAIVSRLKVSSFIEWIEAR